MQFKSRLNLIVLTLSIAVSACAAVSIEQAVTWDLKNYHIYSGYALLNKPLHYDFAPAQVQTFYNPLLHVPTYVAFEFLPGTMAIALFGALQGLNIFLLFLIAQTLFSAIESRLRTVLSLCCAATGFYGAANLGELGATFADNMLSVPILCGFLLLLRHILRKQPWNSHSRNELIAAGVLIGAAFGLKLNIAPYALAAGAAFLAATAIRKEGIRPVLIFSSSMLLAFVCVYGFWGAVLYLEYQNPFYPYLNKIFQSPYYGLVNTADERFFPRDWQQSLFYPFYFAHRNNLVSEIKFRDARLAFCYVGFFLGLLFYIIRLRSGRNAGKRISEIPGSAATLFLMLFFALSYIAWQKLFSIYRYVIVLEMLAPLFIAAILFLAFKQQRLAPAMLSLLCFVLIINSVVPINFGARGIRYESLKFATPEIEGLDRSVVLMTGDMPTAYVIPRFPATTRFLRIGSNFFRPGMNSNLDEKIARALAAYPANRILAYLPNLEDRQTAYDQISYYGLRLDLSSCIELRSTTECQGMICRAVRDSGSYRTSIDAVERWFPKAGVELRPWHGHDAEYKTF